MASVMAIVSKAVFEQLAKQKGGAALGVRLGLDRYGSTHKALAPLAEGGALFAVTVRPPNEALWLVAVLEQPTLGDDGWHAAASTVAITDVTHLKGQLRFANGKGLTAAAGALGMSLQTPRALSAEDEALLRAAAGVAPGEKPAASKPTSKVAPKPVAATPVAKPVAQVVKPASPAPPPSPEPTPPPVASASSAGLTALATAVRAGDGVAALRAALACWQEQPWPELADLIDAISAQISGPPAEDERGFSTLAKSKDPLVLGQMLPAIRSVPVSFLPVAADVLKTFPKDPRLSSAIAGWVLDPPTTSSSTYPFWVRVLDILTRSGDVRVLPRLRERLATKGGGSAFWPKFTTAVGKAADALAALIVKAPSAADAAQIAELARAVSKLRRSEAPAVTAKADKIPTVDGPPLVQAAAHLAANRIPAAIEALLSCWRETRVPAVADAIDRATRLLPTWEKPLDALDEKSAHEAWLAAFAEDATLHLPQLLQYVRVGGSTAATHHVTELATLPDDPRMATHLSAVAAMFGVSPEKAQYWRTLFEIVARAKDVRTCAPLRKDFRDFESTYWYHHKHGRRIVGPFVFDPASAFAKWPLVLDADTQRQFEQVLVRLAEAEARADQTERQLLAEIAGAWSDNGPRLVYADWLSDRGHPRGELIVLACKKQRTKAEEQRLGTLRAAPYLMGALSDFVARDAKLDRGLLGELQLGDVGAFTFRALRGHPLLAVVSSIAFDRTSEDRIDVADFERVILDPALGRLERVSNVSASTLDALSPLVGERFERKGTKLVRRA
ncbi:MAG: TIGR02996 domain-containing protein [Myxococcales bacterium]|nr:TIGR02996 domain-containing protein [Myxococcales bacterium]